MLDQISNGSNSETTQAGSTLLTEISTLENTLTEVASMASRRRLLGPIAPLRSLEKAAAVSLENVVHLRDAVQSLHLALSTEAIDDAQFQERSSPIKELVHYPIFDST